MDPEKKSLNYIFPTKYVIPKSLKFGHWLSESNTFSHYFVNALNGQKGDIQVRSICRNLCQMAGVTQIKGQLGVPLTYVYPWYLWAVL